MLELLIIIASCRFSNAAGTNATISSRIPGMLWSTQCLRALDVFSDSSVSSLCRTSRQFIIACGAIAFGPSEISHHCRIFNGWWSTSERFMSWKRLARSFNLKIVARITSRALESICIMATLAACLRQLKRRSRSFITIKPRSRLSRLRFLRAVHRWIISISRQFSISRMSSATCRLLLNHCSWLSHRDRSAYCTQKHTSSTLKACREIHRTSVSGTRRWRPRENLLDLTHRDCHRAG